VRIHRRRGSDGLIGVTFPFEDYHEDLPVVLDDRQTALEEAFVWNEAAQEEEYIGMPIMRDRLSYSFIWDRYSLFTVDTNAILDGGIRIDPTNKNINLKAEISKLIKKTNNVNKT